jgi:uncharacterized protein YneR
MLSKDEVTQIFEDNLKSQPYWAKIMGSQFAIGIINFISQVVYRCLSLASRELAEAHLSLAIRPSSVLAAAENKGYVRVKITPSLGSVTVINGGTVSLYIPESTTLLSTEGISYITSVAINVLAGQSEVVKVKQLLKKRISTVVTGDTKYLELKLSKNDSANTHELEVLVDNGNGTEQWERSYLFRSGTSTSKMYVEFYTPTEQLGVRFGDDVIAKKVPDGATVHLDVWLTEGRTTLITGQELSFEAAKFSDASAVTLTPIVGGLPQESIESVRKGALYSASFNGEVVWSGDYRSYISSILPTIEWINVWGEQEQEIDSGHSLANINKIFICAYSRVFNQAELHRQIAEIFTADELFNLELSFVNVNLVPLAITLNGTVEPQEDLGGIEAKLTSAITEEYGENAAIRTDVDGNLIEIKNKDLWRFIDDQALLIDFDLAIPALAVARSLPDYRYIDIATSTITIER